MRRVAALQRRQERAAEQRQREHERARKAAAKVAALDAAAEEVEEYEADLAELLSVHHDCSPPVDWPRLACALAPHAPVLAGTHAFQAELRQQLATCGLLASPGATAVEGARLLDAQVERESERQHSLRQSEQARLGKLAQSVLRGDGAAYLAAVQEFASWEDVRGLLLPLKFDLSHQKLLVCNLTVVGTEVVPAEVKSLTSSGKLSVKAMPRARFQEIYEDYVCGCVLRVGREIMAILPVATLLVTASVQLERDKPLPVLSVALSRAALARLDFAQLDPSDTIETLPHRGEVRASRKTGEFVPIQPLVVQDVMPAEEAASDLQNLLRKVREARASLTEASRPRTPTGQN